MAMYSVYIKCHQISLLKRDLVIFTFDLSTKWNDVLPLFAFPISQTWLDEIL